MATISVKKVAGKATITVKGDKKPLRIQKDK